MATSAKRIVIVTGAASGIGLATAVAFADRGDVVVGLDKRRTTNGDRICDERGIEFVLCDVTDTPALEAAIDDVVRRHGRLDVLVNNAGRGLVKPITDVDEAEWDAVLDVNLKATFFGTKFAVRHMQRTGGGAIVNNASNAGLLPRAHDPVYSISKLAVVGLTRSLALCHAPDRIRINCVCPGPVGGTDAFEAELARSGDPDAARRRFIAASPLAHALGRTISPEEVAAAIVYLASDEAAMVTGTALSIDGGKSLGVPPRAG